MLKHEIKKITHYEYWSFWVFYAPLIPLYLWLSIKARSLLYFTATNPGLEHGGLFNYSKFKLQEQLNPKLRPSHQFLPLDKRNLFTPTFDFPFIAKPNFGQRGKNVEIINNKRELKAYLNYNQEDILFQEYIDLPIELGVFYAKYPKTNKSKILSITGKKFLEFVGDGVTSLREFIESDARAYFNKSYLYMKYHEQQDLILPKGESLILEQIGNHNRGTYFYDESKLITPELEEVFDAILTNIDGFYYGRIDIKVRSIEDLYKGNLKIIELNGSNSEATHIYDEKYGLITAYKEVWRHLKVQNEIAIQNIQTGHKPEALSKFVPELTKFLFK